MNPPPFARTEDDLLSILLELQRREPIFHRASMSSIADQFQQLMAPDYWEVGASGRRYSREFILHHLAENAPVDATKIGWQTSEFACRRLGPDTFLLTYTLQQGDRWTRRSTIWCRAEGDWQILYHQGTIIAVENDHIVPSSPGIQQEP